MHFPRRDKTLKFIVSDTELGNLIVVAEYKAI